MVPTRSGILMACQSLKGQYLEGRQHGEWNFYDKNGEQLPSLSMRME